jgi:transposase InsO family protein
VDPASARHGATLPALNASFRPTLRAEDKCKRTVKSYTEAVGLLTDFLATRGHSLTVNAVKRADVRDFIADQLQRWKPATALNRYRSEGAEVLLAPVRAPTANACAERWVRTVPANCLDWLLIVGRGHLERVLRVCVKHYNEHRPHRALGLQAPDRRAGVVAVGGEQQGRVRRRDLLGGLLHEYQQAA